MAFRRRATGFPRFRQRKRFGRSWGGSNKAWVGASANDASVGVLDVSSGSWFTDIIFTPIVELADYAFGYQGVPPGSGDFGVGSKQDRCTIHRLVGDLNFNPSPGSGGSNAIWSISWYIAAFRFQEIENAIALGPLGVFEYDPLASGGAYLFRVNRMVMHKFHILWQAPSLSVGGGADVEVGESHMRNWHIDVKMNMQLRTDEELYLVWTGAAGQTTENAPALAMNMALRARISD